MEPALCPAHVRGVGGMCLTLLKMPSSRDNAKVRSTQPLSFDKIWQSWARAIEMLVSRPRAVPNREAGLSYEGFGHSFARSFRFVN